MLEPLAFSTGYLSEFLRDLVSGRGFQVDTEFVGETNQVQQDISHFISNSRRLLSCQVATLLFRKPLEGFEEFSRLYGERGRQVLRGVKLIPIAVLCEAPQLVSQQVKDTHRSAVLTFAHANPQLLLSIPACVWVHFLLGTNMPPSVFPAIYKR